MSVKKIRTVLVDNELRALNRMKILLSNFPEIEVIGQFEQPGEGLDYILKCEPDLAFLDVEMSGKSGLEIAEEIQRNHLNTSIVYITAYDHYAINAIKTGAFDYLLKPVNIDELKTTLNRYQAEFQLNLSRRELDIIRLLARGMNSKAIGEELFISRHTVDTYRRKILEKTGCKNSAELIRYASDYSLI